ncbi:MAG: FtsW/RodA/SpoVE family cell cycle protein [Patescibacteria group bacterium]
MRQLVVLPLLYFCFAVVSLSIIASIAPNLVYVQFIFFLLGSCIFFCVSFFNFNLWRKYHWWLYGGSLLALIITLSLGIVHKGAARWIPIGPINFQPSQFAQPITIVTLSFFLGSNSLRKFSNLIKYSLLIVVPWFLTIIEPNLSTSLIFLFFAGMMALHSDLPVRWIGSALVFIFILSIIGWIFVVKPYQKQRILTFLSPDDHQESSYNARQSMIAVGSGGLMGRGLGHGVQSQLRFLPERQTDFIFASLAEELGLLGSFLVLFLYGILFFFLSLKLSKSQNTFFQSLFIGFLSFFCIQVTINIGMNMGILPITGITLPFLSYGGSSLLSFALSFGILERAIIETNTRTVFQLR